MKFEDSCGLVGIRVSLLKCFYMFTCVVQKYDVFVTGIDLSANMISIALEKAAAYNDPRVS